MIRDGDCYRAFRHFLLHDDVASASSNFHKAVPNQNRTILFTGEDTQLTQWRPQLE
jgi:hypothetical protein